MPLPVFLTRTVLVASLAMAMETVFVAIADLPEAQDWRLKGHTYVWMFPIYATIYPGLSWLYPRLAGWPFPARGLLYVALIYAVEYASGWAIRAAVGKCPWDYTGRKWAVHGLIRLDFAPAWFAASLVYEAVFRFLRG